MSESQPNGVVELLLAAVAAGEPMELRAEVQVLPGVGIPGDRYATGSGHWSDPRWPDQELTLVETELAEELSIDPILLRRNIVTRGVRLDDLIGKDFVLGSATLRGVRHCDPCRYLESTSRPGLFDELRGRGGLRARVINGGTIAVGDHIHQSPYAAPAGSEGKPLSTRH